MAGALERSSFSLRVSVGCLSRMEARSCWSGVETGLTEVSGCASSLM